MGSQFSIARAMSTEEGVYGLILVSGLIATAGTSGASAWKALLFTAITVAVFWLAHVYAATIALHGTKTEAGEPVGVRSAMAQAARKSRGLLASTVFPALVLLLGAVGILDDAASMWAALWVCVAALAVLGYLTYLRKGARLSMRLVGALSMAAFGVVIILAKAFVAH